MNNFFNELKRRNVVRVGIAYLAISWLIAQVVDLAADNFNAPEWVAQTILIGLLIGLPIVLLFSWAFEITPEGVKKTKDVDKSKSVSHGTGRKIDKLIIAALATAVIVLLVDRFWLSNPNLEGEREVATSIAVLPFVNLSQDPEQEFFSDGISEELLNVLVRVDGLDVASRTTAFSFKGKDLSIQQMAESLGVEHILEGSVRRSGDTIRITAQLIDARTDRHLWSETYDREFKDIFVIQDEISSAIVTSLRETLGFESLGDSSVPVVTENLSAYEAFITAREFFINRLRLDEAVALLEGAVAQDPNYAEAMELLSATYSIMPSWRFFDRDYYTLARETAEKAIALKPDLSTAYAVLGSHYSIDQMSQGLPPDWKSAMANYNQAIANDPKNTPALQWRGVVLIELGRPDLAIIDFDNCLAADPLYGNCKRHKASAVLTMGDEAGGLALYLEGIEEGFTVLGAFLPYYYLYAKAEDPVPFSSLNSAVWQQSGFPVETAREAVKTPDQPRPDLQAIASDWIRKNTPMEIILRDPWWSFLYGNFDGMESVHFDYSYFQWWPVAEHFRKHPKFKELAEARRFREAWEIIGMPERCRPVGDDDFECD